MGDSDWRAYKKGSNKGKIYRKIPRAVIEKATDEYLKNGGKITVIEKILNVSAAPLGFTADNFLHTSEEKEIKYE